MKFSVSSSELLRHLQIAGSAIGSNPVLPILDDFLFKIENKVLYITGSDLETNITTSLEVMADTDFAVAIPGKILLETIKALPQQPLTFTVNPDNFAVEITSSYGKYRLAGENGDDYPDMPTPDHVDTVGINSRYLLEGVAKTIFAASNDELRPAMTGVYFQIDFNKLTCVATDAHKLVKYATPHLAGEVSTSFIAPKKALNILKSNLPADTAVQIAFNKSNAFFSFDSISLVCRLIDARYPDYNAVIPVETPIHVVLNRADFLHSLKRIAIYANKTTNQVALDIQSKSLTISSQDLDFSNEATEQMSCELEGAPIRIAYNAKFMIEMLSVLDSEEIRLQISSASRASLLVPIEPENTDREILMLVMPVMLNN